MVDGVFSRAFKSNVRPIELGRRMLREMDEHRSVDVRGRRIVPNHFTFWLSPGDHAGFAEIDEALMSELGEAARAYAREESYHFMGPVSVELTVQNELKAGRFHVSSQMRVPRCRQTLWCARTLPSRSRTTMTLSVSTLRRK